jgi:hypothetical protein
MQAGHSLVLLQAYFIVKSRTQVDIPMPVRREGCKYCQIEWLYENSYNGKRNPLREEGVCVEGRRGRWGAKMPLST